MAVPSELTIADVAKVAGVSVSTVSRILNGKHDVADSTRKRVLEVIEQLGYAPSTQAQRLRAGKSRNIALLFPLKYARNIPYNPLDTDFIVSAAASAGEKGFFFSLLTNEVTEQSLLNLYRSEQIDGLVLMQIYERDWRVELLRKHNYPFVMIGHCEDNTGLSFIDLDFEASVIVAFEHLLKNGHQHIGFITLPAIMRQEGYGPAIRSWRGYQDILERYHIPHISREIDFDEQSVFDATVDLLKKTPEITAIVTTHVNGAFSIIQALGANGRHIPQDCALIAMTVDKMATLTTPPLTHVDFPAYEMGYQAVDMLLRILKEEITVPQQVLITPQLIIRST